MPESPPKTAAPPRVLNFNAGPAMLPRPVMEQAQAEFLDYGRSGISILESSHRAPQYDVVHHEAMTNVAELLGLGDDHAVLFIPGGASMQFPMVPMNLLAPGQTADYTLSGAWAAKAVKEARRLGEVAIAADCAADRPARVPTAEELRLTKGAAYLHITTNETIAGAQWKTYPECEAPLVADMSSDIFSRPIDAKRFGLIYAGAQKNLGPAGVALVIVRRDLAERAPESLPAILRYRTYIETDSLFNTPPVFTIYLICLVTRWLKEQGGLEAMGRRNAAKAQELYSAIDASGFYSALAAPRCRSFMNVTFRLPSEELDKRFASEADAAGLKGLEGHRSVGGIRASIYNAFPPEGVAVLVDFMKEFERRNG